MSQRRLFYGWTVLAAAATIVAIGQGALLSFGVFLKPLEESMRWNRSDISMVALLNWLAMGAGSFVWGALSDRLGGRAVAVAGGLLMGLGFVVSSQATELWQLDVTFGLAVGFAAGAFLTPLSATATKWFTASRGLARSVRAGPPTRTATKDATVAGGTTDSASGIGGPSETELTFAGARSRTICRARRNRSSPIRRASLRPGRTPRIASAPT